MHASDTANEHFHRGRAQLLSGAYDEALDHFRTAHELEPTSAVLRSYYGLGLALAERRFDQALELCRSAAKEEFFNPELYLNLARVHLAFGFKGEALRYLRRGLMIDPAHPGLVAELRDLGLRQQPILTFLPRHHPVNRWLGRCKTALSRGSLAA
jgi:tetratricopeptide (TPR) repeat protein